MTVSHTTSIASLTTLPVGVLIALGAVLAIELVLDVIALVDLFRRPVSRVALGNKWVWLAIILLVNLLGSVVYLIVGRKPAPATDQPPAGASTTPRTNIADALYGDAADSEQ